MFMRILLLKTLIIEKKIKKINNSILSNVLANIYMSIKIFPAQSARAVEYTDYISAEG